MKKRFLIILHIAVMLAVTAGFFVLRSELQKKNTYLTRIEGLLRESELQNAELKQKLQQNAVSAAAGTAPVVYLTFDDGPSDNTEKILDILENYGVKATFFVTGKEGAEAASVYRRIVAEGHGYGNHTYSHEYGEVYASADSFWQDIEKNNALFYAATGKTLDILRFPGGSDNTISERYCKGIMDVLTAQAKERGIVYFDWNVSSRDAEAIRQSTDVIINSVYEGVRGRSRAIVLMHDSAPKDTTVEALPTVIESLINQGFVFETLNASTPPIQFK